MSTSTERKFERADEMREIDDYELDLIHELGRHLGCLWEYDRCTANSTGKPELQEFWRAARSREQRTIEKLKNLIKHYSQSDAS